MLHISLKNTSGWGLLMKQHSNFSRENDKHSHKAGNFFPQKDFLCLLIYYNCSRWGIYFFRCKDFSVHLFARFHFMNRNVYLATLIFCSYLRVSGREQLCAIKFYSNNSEEMQKYYPFKRVILQYKTSQIQYSCTATEMFQ